MKNSIQTFEDLGIGKQLIKAITELGFEHPTPIQEQAIPLLLKGEKDLVGLAQTGTGKTAAFGLPLLEQINLQATQTQALILAPTRELCVQIARDIESFGKHTDGIKITAVYGGASIQNQIQQIRRGNNIIVATPGRLLDLMNKKVVKLSEVKWVVLDEADEMLNMGFQEDIHLILSETPDEKRVWLFSATMPPEVRRIAQNYMKNIHELTVGKKNAGAENVTHSYFVVHARDRYAALKRIVDYNPDIFGIVFCRTKVESQEVAEHLIKDGYNADALHGDLSQQQRDKVMKRFREKSLQLLIATDVAARGIDVENITHILHYNLPDEIENYTHRSGRTARAGKSGFSIALINTREVGKIKMIERQIGKAFTQGKIPDGFQICEKQLFHLIHKVHDTEVQEKEMASYLPRIHKELAQFSKEEVINRFVSLEFNRFLEYYRNAPDLNISESRHVDNFRGERYSSGNRMFINLGSVDGLSRGSLLEYICNVADIDKKAIGQIDIKGVFSFFEVEGLDAASLQKMKDAFRGEKYKSRDVHVESSGEERRRPERGGERRNGGGGRKSYRPQSGNYKPQSGGYKSEGGNYKSFPKNRDSDFKPEKHKRKRIDRSERSSSSNKRWN